MKLLYNKTLLSLSIVTILMLAFVLASNTTFAVNDSVVDQINITVPVSCTISGTGMNTHNAEIQNGTYQANIGTTTLHAFCNDNNGFAIYAAGYTGNEIGGTNSNKLVGTSASSNATIVTGLATSTPNPDVSNWAMKLAIIQDSGDTTGTNALAIDSAPNTSGGADTSFSQYHTVPNEYTKVAHKNSATDMTASTGGVKLTTTYAAYISKAQPADTYTGQVIYTLVHPSFANSEGCNPSGTSITTIVCMQDISSTNKSSILSSMTLEQQYTLKDKRDGKYYTVAKLKDGNIWMTQNLDLDLDSTKTYTNLDTDLGWNTNTSTYDTASWTPIASTKPSTDTTWDNTVTGRTTPQSYDPGNLYWSGTPDDSTPISSGNSHYHLGNYYNWSAAIAMNDNSSILDRNTVVEQSICPSGWTLPRTGSGDKTFQTLWEQYGFSGSRFDDIIHITGTPAYFTAGGTYYGSLQIGSNGSLWSPVVPNGSAALIAYFNLRGYATPAEATIRVTGTSVRCLVR